MLIIIGLLLIPFILLILLKANLFTTKKSVKVFLNILLVLISLVYIILCWVIGSEPFDFTTKYSVEYMLYNGEYILYSGLIFLFTPFMWIVAIHFIKMIYFSLKIRKNAIIKRTDEYIYYRGDLDKVSPSTIMFTSMFEVDLKKSIAATILKLKLNGYIVEKEGKYVFVDKDTSNLLQSELMVLNLIKTETFDKKKYIAKVEEESLKSKYIKKNIGGKPIRIVKILIAIAVPIVVYIFSVWLDNYQFTNYKIWPEDDNHTYIILEKDEDIEKLYDEVKNQDDYYSRPFYDGTRAYNYTEIRADKFEYSVVRKTLFLNIVGTFLIGFIEIFVLISIYIISEQIRYFNKNYSRTIKGKRMLNKAYALKNYLKDFSVINTRTEEELILWDYYLVYATILGVNVKIQDELIQKYVKKIV